MILSQDEISAVLVKERDTPEDQILAEGSEEHVVMTKLLDNKDWREMLKELVAVNKESTLPRAISTAATLTAGAWLGYKLGYAEAEKKLKQMAA